MMRFVVAIVAAVALTACLISATSIMRLEGHQNDMSMRLGHFREDPFTDLYKMHAAVFKLPAYGSGYVGVDSNKFYAPTRVECITFFTQFRIDQYKPRDLDDIVVMDACLGYLYDQRDPEEGDESEGLVQYHSDQTLGEIYNNTKINNLDGESQLCIGNLLLNSILAKNQYPNVVCNNLYLQVYLDFAECQTNIRDLRTSDSYLKIIYETLKERVKSCVDEELHHINTAMRKAFQADPIERIRQSITKKFITKDKQASERMWPKQVMKLLTAFQNSTGEVSLRQVHTYIKGVEDNNDEIKKIVLNNLAYYATKRISGANPKKDPAGLILYRTLINDLCRFFRSSDKEEEYDFATPIIRLVQLLKYEQLFGITQDQFIKKMFTQGMETAPIYAGVQACNILTFTEGTFSNSPAITGKPSYTVVFRADTSGMIQWPNAGYY